MKSYSIPTAYFGSPAFSAHVLQSLIQDMSIPISIKLVSTQPDRPVGRKKILTPTPVKEVALENYIPVIHGLPTKDDLQKYSIKLCIVYAYKNIIPDSLLNAPEYGFWNIHPSLLPLYRGSSPVVYPLLLGDTKTGVSIILMDNKLDHGPIIAQTVTDVDSQDTHKSLLIKLSREGYDLLKTNLHTNNPQNLIINAQPQDHKRATYTTQLTRNDGYVSPQLISSSIKGHSVPESYLPEIMKSHLHQRNNRVENHSLKLYNSLEIMHNIYRGLYNWPGIWTQQIIQGENKRVKIIDVKRQDKNIIIENVQIEGKTPISYHEYKSRYGEIQ